MALRLGVLAPVVQGRCQRCRDTLIRSFLADLTVNLSCFPRGHLCFKAAAGDIKQSREIRACPYMAARIELDHPESFASALSKVLTCIDAKSQQVEVHVHLEDRSVAFLSNPDLGCLLHVNT